MKLIIHICISTFLFFLCLTFINSISIKKDIFDKVGDLGNKIKNEIKDAVGKVENLGKKENNTPTKLELTTPVEINNNNNDSYKYVSYTSPSLNELQIQRFFSKPKTSSDKCSDTVNIYLPVNKPEFQEAEYISQVVPKKKPNPFKVKKHGFEDSAYMFDWLDGFLKKEIVAIFKLYFLSANQIQEDPEVKDLYSVENQIKAFQTMGAGYQVVSTNVMSPDDEFNILMKMNPNMIKSNYMTGINISKLSAILKTWEWVNVNEVNWQKKIFDKYDFNGDGRISINEFLTLAISLHYENSTLGSVNVKFSFSEITGEKIDGLFNFADCNSDGFISAEELWNSIKLVRRQEDLKGRFDIFSCDAGNDNEFADFRSSSVNDFFLKNSYTVKGKLSLNEFRKGILVAYLNRQVNDSLIVDDDSINGKFSRWQDNGLVDIGCLKLKKVTCVNCSLK